MRILACVLAYQVPLRDLDVSCHKKIETLLLSTLIGTAIMWWIKPAATTVATAFLLQRTTDVALKTRTLSLGAGVHAGMSVLMEPPVSTGRNKEDSSNEKSCHFKTKQTSIVSNQGPTATFMLYWPSITTFTLESGWTPQHTEKLKKAVNKVVERNPILTGRAQTSGLWGRNTKVSIKPGTFPVSQHSFVSEKSFGAGIPFHFTNVWPDLEHKSDTELIRFMDESLTPLVPPAESVVESVKSGNPLFDVHVLTIPGGYACLAVRLSHCVGDGVAYYNIMNEINYYFNHLDDDGNDDGAEKGNHHPPPLLEWTAPAIAQHEIWPSRYSKADVQKAYGVSFLLGLLRNVWNIDAHAKDYIVLSKDKIEKKKKELVDKSQHSHLSSNDIITAALCEANGSSDLFCFTMNMRFQPHCRHFGFNFHNEVPFPSKVAAANPNAFRSILKQGYYYDTDKLPTWPFVAGRVGRVSSLASVQHVIASKDTKVLFHGMLASYVQNVPLDCAFITSMNDDKFLVIHNFREINTKSGLLHDILIDE